MNMKKYSFVVPVLVGLMFGQLFAEGRNAFGLENTIKFGYNDNLYQNSSGEKSAFISDVIDLSFRAALSDRTDILAKTQLTFLSDEASTELSPSMYVMLTHGVSPRLLFRLSEYYRQSPSTGSGTVVGTNKRTSYYENKVRGSADYILDQRNLLTASAGHAIMRNKDDKKDGLNLDYTTVDAGVGWKHDIALQRTYSIVDIKERHTKYENRNSTMDATDISAGLGHTFNPEWQGNFSAGVTHARPDEAGAVNESSLNPLFNIGLTYTPSPLTRLSAGFSSRYQESGNNSYGGETSHELSFGAQHSLTAKLLAKATARFTKTQYDENSTMSTTATTEEDRMDLDFRLTYTVNRINFIEAGVKHTEVNRDVGVDWDQNMVDVGWRIILK